MTDHDDPQNPESPDEIDVDLTDDGAPDTVRDNIEFLGEYASVQAYLKSVLDDLMPPEIVWILDHLDYGAVTARFESDGTRYFCEAGSVYRAGPGT